MNLETYNEGKETDKKSQDYSSSHGNVDRHRHSHRNVDRHRHNHGNVGTYIEGMESDTSYGDYSSDRSGCPGITLICNTTNERIKPGSCQFT